ncbi:MAG TPA: DUF1634 domain-containing protein [Thermoanaerobaculia bacterium]
MKKNFFGIAANTLRIGVAVSAVFLIAALVDSVVAHDAVATVTPSGLGEAFRGVLRFETGALVHLGIVVLLLTPIARLVAVATEFMIRREASFVAISVGVLLLLGASVWIGLL